MDALDVTLPIYVFDGRDLMIYEDRVIDEYGIERQGLAAGEYDCFDADGRVVALIPSKAKVVQVYQLVPVGSDTFGFARRLRASVSAVMNSEVGPADLDDLKRMASALFE